MARLTLSSSLVMNKTLHFIYFIGQQEIASPVPGSNNLKSGIETQGSTSAPEKTPTDDVREKRPMTAVHLAGRTAALNEPPPQRDRGGDVYFIGELTCQMYLSLARNSWIGCNL